MKTHSVTVRSADKGDVERIIEIERSWVHLSHWSVDAYYRLVDDDAFTTSLVAVADDFVPSRRPAKREGPIVGFVIFHASDRAAEIYNIAVERRQARTGVGSALMKSVIELSQDDGAHKLTLEVRKSNANAISFYRGFRFNTVGERASYYSNPVEDAYVMQRDLRY
jgi:ribosomal-protein-alanine acetyltransferase